MAVDDKAYRENLQAESLRLFPGSSRSARQRRKEWRNAQRAEEGFRPESALSRSGLAGVWDRNKDVITPVAAGLAGLATGGLTAPLLLGAGLRGVDREGEGGVGFNAGQALRGAAEGAAAGGLASAGAGAVGAARAASAAGASPLSAAWQGAQTLLPGAAAPAGVTPVPVGTAAAAAPAAGGQTFLQRAGGWLRDPQNLLMLGQGVAGTYAEQQALNEARRAMREFDLDGVDRTALAEREFDRFAASSAPAYEAALRDANRYAAATGRLNSGSLRTEYGNLANLRAQQLDAARSGFLDDAVSQSIQDAQWRAQNRAAARQNIGNIYSNRAQAGASALGNLARTLGRGPVPLGNPPSTPPISAPRTPAPVLMPTNNRVPRGMVRPVPMGAV